VPKISLLCLAITLDIHESILVIFGRNITEEVSNKRCFIFPPHLTSASALPGQTENPEIASFHFNDACRFNEKTQNTLKISPGHRCTTYLHCQNYPAYAPDRTQEGSVACCSMLPSRLMFFFIGPGVDVSEQFCRNILLSQQLLDAINASFIIILSFSMSVHRCILRLTQPNCCSAKLKSLRSRRC